MDFRRIQPGGNNKDVFQASYAFLLAMAARFSTADPKVMAMLNMCPVCGYPNLKHDPMPTYGGGSYEICPSCGFQFGVSDEDVGHSFAEWRDEWIANGMRWSSVAQAPPAEWDPVAQLERVSARDVDHAG
jgi:hypothetical protein